MKLIDKEKIRYTDLAEGRCPDGVYVAWKDWIDKIPTVDAIPVQWLKDIIATNVHLWEEGKERMFVDQGVVTVISYSLTAQVLSELLDRWEKGKLLRSE